MTISDLKDLESLIKLCRKTGVDNIKVDGIELQLGDEPVKPLKASKKARVEQPAMAPGGITADAYIPTPGYPSQEQLLYMSSDPSVMTAFDDQQ